MLLLIRYATASAWIRPPLLQRVARRRAHFGSSLAHTPNFLEQVEETVSNVLNQYPDTSNDDFVFSLDPPDREAYSVAQVLKKRLESFYRPGVNCPRCWLQEAHCICAQCPPVSLAHLPIRRFFIVMHHKEIALTVDTAKLILNSFPEQCRLVVAGMGPQYQASMREMMEAIDGEETKCLLLFPTDDAKTFAEIVSEDPSEKATTRNSNKDALDLIVIDGTWPQARKIHGRYFDEKSPTRVQLSEASLESLQSTTEGVNGHRQLRRHPIDWRTISTMEATRLLLKDIAVATEGGNDFGGRPFWEILLSYQQTANQAALKQLGPPRLRQEN